MTLIDYAWNKPTPAQIVAAGHSGVLRYLSNDPTKDLTPSERDGLRAAGLTIGLVWETTTTRAAQGYAAGRADALAADSKADSLGYPTSAVMFYAVDYDARVSAVLAYFQGVVSVSRRPVGVYGSAAVVEGVPVPWKWQTVAWSHDRVSPQAHIYQTLIPTLPGCGLDQQLHPVPLWTTTATAPAPIPVKDSTMLAFIKVQNDVNVYVTDGVTAWHVKDEQTLADYAYLSDHDGLYKINQPAPGSSGAVQINGVWVREVGSMDLVGNVVNGPGTSPAPAPAPAPAPVDAASLAAQLAPQLAVQLAAIIGKGATA